MEPDRAYRRRWWTLGVMCLSLLVIGLDNTILNVALPTPVRDLHTDASQLEWIADAYALVFATGSSMACKRSGNRLCFQ